MSVPILEVLQSAVAGTTPLPEILSRLRQCRDLGVTRGEVRSVLEGLRESAPDEAAEDRVLEILDFVTGFCSPSNTIWDDEPRRFG